MLNLLPAQSAMPAAAVNGERPAETGAPIAFFSLLAAQDEAPAQAGAGETLENGDGKGLPIDHAAGNFLPSLAAPPAPLPPVNLPAAPLPVSASIADALTHERPAHSQPRQPSLMLPSGAQPAEHPPLAPATPVQTAAVSAANSQESGFSNTQHTLDAPLLIARREPPASEISFGAVEPFVLSATLTTAARAGVTPTISETATAPATTDGETLSTPAMPISPDADTNADARGRQRAEGHMLDELRRLVSFPGGERESIAPAREGEATSLLAPTPQTAGATAVRGGEPPLPSQAPIPLQQEGWEQVLAQRVAWLLSHARQQAHLNVHPPALGPLEVRIEMKQDQATINFVSTHAAVREALEAAIPRLREMFADSGLNLLDVNVSAHMSSPHRRDPSPWGERVDGGLRESPSEPSAQPSRRAPVGLIDLFA